MAEKRNTKQVILEQSLHLFSIHGYEGVSVKEIAAAVGIKDSSLYKHYKSKQEIFDTLLEEMLGRIAGVAALYRFGEGEAASAAVQYGENRLEWLRKTAETLFLYFLEDEAATKLIRLLTLEQYRNPHADKVFRELSWDVALEFLTRLFREMIRQGILLEEGDPEILALQFYAPLHLLLLRNLGAPEKAGEALEQLARHMERFAALYWAPPPPPEDEDE